MQNNNLAYLDHIVKAALESVSFGYAIFLLAPGAKVPRAGTHGKWVERGMTDEQEIRSAFLADPTANYGIALTEYDLVIDCDPKNYPPAYDSDKDDLTVMVPDEEKIPTKRHNVMLDILAECPALYQTRIVHTPSNGWHFYLKKPWQDVIAKKNPKYPGVDFLSVGNLVVGPGSCRHGNYYTLVESKRALEIKANG